jgi:hypothetical protein
VRLTDSIAPCEAEFGFTPVSTGVAPATVTLNPLLAVSTSVPVVTVTLRAPVDVRDEIVIFAVALVAFATVTLFTVIPAPKLAVVVPWTKFVD